MEDHTVTILYINAELFKFSLDVISIVFGTALFAWLFKAGGGDHIRTHLSFAGFSFTLTDSELRFSVCLSLEMVIFWITLLLL